MGSCGVKRWVGEWRGEAVGQSQGFNRAGKVGKDWEVIVIAE